MKGHDIKNYLNKIDITKLITLTGSEFKCIDIGFIDTNKWLIVEINPMYSLDDYEMNITDYMNFCVDSCIWINNQIKLSNKNDVLNYWFPSPGFQKFWFNGKYNTEIDNDIRERFLPQIKLYFCGELNIFDDNNHDSILAQIILLDQFTRNIYRNIPIDNDLVTSNFINTLYKNLSRNLMANQEFIRTVIDYEGLKLAEKYLTLIKDKNIDPPFEHIVFALMPYRHSPLVENKQFVVDYLENYKTTHDNIQNNALFIKFEKTSKRKLQEVMVETKSLFKKIK